MIEPERITRYDRTDYELEELACYGILTIATNATAAAWTTHRLLVEVLRVEDPPTASVLAAVRAFETRRSRRRLERALQNCGARCFKLKAEGLRQLARADLNLRTCSRQDLMQVYGIAEKTAELFLLHSREGHVGACLDTHVRRYAGLGAHTLNGQAYDAGARKVLRLAQRMGMTPAEADLAIWKEMRSRRHRA